MSTLSVTWRDLPNRDQDLVIDPMLRRLLCVVIAAERSLARGRTDLARRSLRKAIALVAAILRLGYVTTRLEARVTRLRLKLEVAP